jgi:hypothetical protein
MLMVFLSALLVIAIVGLVIATLRAVGYSQQCSLLGGRIAALESERRILETKLLVALDEDKRKIGWLDTLDEDIKVLQAELKKRPKIVRKTYKIITFGVKATGKTSLTLKWANPLINLGCLQGTKIERYERTVSHVLQDDVMTEHVFQVGDWGGEHIVDAQHELIMDEIHGLLIVVDLAGRDGKCVEPARIQEQLQEFQLHALRYFFSAKTMASCKSVVLFINKSDLLPGTPAEVEVQAKKLYAPLIDNLMRYSTELDIRVFVGSACYGHSTHLLFSHFVQRILPHSAYDQQLMQRMDTELGNPVPSAPAPPIPPAAAPACAMISTTEKTAPLPTQKPPLLHTKRPAEI